jgi:hypothetical protein
MESLRQLQPAQIKAQLFGLRTGQQEEKDQNEQRAAHIHWMTAGDLRMLGRPQSLLFERTK